MHFEDVPGPGTYRITSDFNVSVVYPNGQILADGAEVRRAVGNGSDDKEEKPEGGRPSKSLALVMPGPYFRNPTVRVPGIKPGTAQERCMWLNMKANEKPGAVHFPKEKAGLIAPDTKRYQPGAKEVITLNAVKKMLEAKEVRTTETNGTAASVDALGAPPSTAPSSSLSARTRTEPRKKKEKYEGMEGKFAAMNRYYNALAKHQKKKEELYNANVDIGAPGPKYDMIDMHFLSQCRSVATTRFAEPNSDEKERARKLDLNQRSTALSKARQMSNVGPGKYDVSAISFGREACKTTVFGQGFKNDGKQHITEKRFKDPLSEPYISKKHNQVRQGLYGPGPLYNPKNGTVEDIANGQVKPPMGLFPLGPGDRPRTCYSAPGVEDRSAFLHMRNQKSRITDLMLVYRTEHCGPGPAYLKQFSSFSMDGDAELRRKLMEREDFKSLLSPPATASAAKTRESQSARGAREKATEF